MKAGKHNNSYHRNVHRGDCYAYDISKNTWVKVADLLYPVHAGGFDSHPDWGFGIAGGKDPALRAEIQITEDGSAFSNTINMEEGRQGRAIYMNTLLKCRLNRLGTGTAWCSSTTTHYTSLGVIRQQPLRRRVCGSTQRRADGRQR